MFTIDEATLIEIIARGENEKVEFKRSPDPHSLAETICAFLNTDGGIIIVGVTDEGKIVGTETKKAIEKLTIALGSIRPYPEIKTKKMNLGKKSVLIIKVNKSDKIHTYRNLVYVRIGASNRPLSLEEIVEKATESLILRFDELPSEAPLEEIDIDLVKEFLKKREEIRGIKTRGTLEENLKLLKIIVKKDSTKVPTNAGILFFCKLPQRWIPQAKVHLIWFTDESMNRYVDSKFFEGPVWKIIDDIEEYLYKNLRKIGGELIGWKRIEIMEYPIRALREAIANAITHRNYFDPSEVKIFIFPTKIIIQNPGSFPPGVTPENPIHKPRNPLIAQYMYDMGYIEKYGYGIRMMQEECEKHPLVKLKFNLRPYITEVIFQKTIKQQILDKLDNEIIKILKEQGESTSGEIARKLSISKPTAIKHLKKLIGLGLIKEKGRGPARRYYLAKI